MSNMASPSNRRAKHATSMLLTRVPSNLPLCYLLMLLRADGLLRCSGQPHKCSYLLLRAAVFRAAQAMGTMLDCITF
jgi:hypothetical protein